MSPRGGSAKSRTKGPHHVVGSNSLRAAGTRVLSQSVHQRRHRLRLRMFPTPESNYLPETRRRLGQLAEAYPVARPPRRHAATAKQTPTPAATRSSMLMRDAPDRALIVFTGRGGMGKTASLHAWAEELSTRTAGPSCPLIAATTTRDLPDEWSNLCAGDFAQVAQLLSGLEAPLDPAVAQALVDYIKLSNTPRMIEFGLFMHLGHLAPDRLVSEDWPALWTNWLPEVRMDLADAFCRCWPGTDFPAEESLRLLVPLLGDGHFGVRRAAARALGRIVPGALFAFCDDMARSERIADRIRAAELSVWMPSASRARIAFPTLPPLC